MEHEKLENESWYTVAAIKAHPSLAGVGGELIRGASAKFWMRAAMPATWEAGKAGKL